MKDGVGFGIGNWGQKGISKFISTHECNSLCKFMNLPLLNSPKNIASGKQWTKGTLPFPKEFTEIQSTQELKELPSPSRVI